MEKWEKIGFFPLVGHPRFTGRWCPSRCPRIFSQSVIVYILVLFVWTPAIYLSLVSQSQSRQNISISISSSQDPPGNLFKLVHFRTPSHPRSNIWWPLEQLRSSRRYASHRNSFLCFLPSATKLRRLCFYRCLSVHRGGWYPSMLCRWYPSMPCSRSPGGCLLRGGCLLWAGACSMGGAAPWGCLLQGGGDPPSRRLLLRTVRILLECILVFQCVYFSSIRWRTMARSKRDSEIEVDPVWTLRVFLTYV